MPGRPQQTKAAPARRPARSKAALSAPTRLPESLTRAIRADALSKKEADARIERRQLRRQEFKTTNQDASMSGALGVPTDTLAKVAAAKANLNTKTDKKEPQAEPEEREVVPSSVEPKETHEVAKLPPAVAPSTVQRPIPQKTALFSGNRRAQATPRFDSSVLGNFKRRPRQPSILGIGRQDDSSTATNTGGLESDPFYSDLEGFDQGVQTPLISSKSISRKQIDSSAQKSHSNIPPISNPRKRRRDDSHEPSEVLIPRSPQITAEEADRLFGSSPAPNHEAEGDVEPSLPKIAKITSRTSETCASEVWSEILAPPQSSPLETTPEPEKRATNPKSKTSRAEKRSPGPTSSKKLVPQTRGQKSRALRSISTAQLQNLLPLRRDKDRSQKNDSIVLAGLDTTSEDVSLYIPVKRTRATSKQSEALRKATTTSSSKSKNTLRDKTNTRKQISGSATPSTTIKSTPAIKATRTSRTYTRSSRIASGQENPRDHLIHPLTTDGPQKDSDAENRDVSNSTIADLDGSIQRERDAIVKKFAEVDNWEMEFEEADEHSSSADGLLLG